MDLENASASYAFAADSHHEQDLSTALLQLLNDNVNSLMTLTDSDLSFDVGMITGSLAIAECSENMGSATNESMHIAQTNQNSQSLLCNMTTESLWNENSYLDEQLMATSMHVAEPYGSTSTTQVEQVNSNIQMEAVTDQNSNTEFFSDSTDDSHLLAATDTVSTVQSLENSRGRKRTRNESNWKRSITKRLRNSGDEYYTKCGKLVVKRCVQQSCGNCRLKCSSNISSTERTVIFNNYWKLGDKNRQNDFITSHVDVLPPPSKGRKQVCKNFYFTVNGQRVRVCQTFFLNTLHVSNKLLHYNTSKIRNEYGVNRLDQRGHQSSANRIPESKRKEVRAHINSFPCMESHCRSQTERKYLEASLNVRKMYDMYKKSAHDPVKENIYRQIFNEHFNLAFHRPKKDFCKLCATYSNMSTEEKSAMQEEFDKHHSRKDGVRALKTEIKQRCIADARHVAVTFDLEQVLYSPKVNVSSLFYKRKLSCYNLTIYNLATGDVSCYMWHEGIGGRGSDEMASCVYDYIQSLPECTEHVYLFSDTCGGQNRNIQMSAALLRACQALANIQTITQYMTESGHSQMECNSVHSTIERACRNIDAFTPLEYYTIVRTARRSQPYAVKVMTVCDFKNMKALVSTYVKNRSKFIDGSAVNWMKTKVLSYKKDAPGVIEMSYDYDGPVNELLVTQAQGRRSRHPPTVINMEADLDPLRTKPPAISKAKYNDLISLCDSLAIPRKHHHFYQSLVCSESVVDRLAEPDVDENSDGE